ncbi:hypothetical protein Vadar_006687 [Vaccinium darrowii]|uniref:Uncharacterized protein n=1 Tax=Vaccinium darrowii TaxID=229202 RepID=A0ACB7XX78_9ERIC|nr:hypothetical protein Vadar_006687 [Vaccinium darrowii]
MMKFMMLNCGIVISLSYFAGKMKESGFVYGVVLASYAQTWFLREVKQSVLCCRCSFVVEGKVWYCFSTSLDSGFSILGRALVNSDCVFWVFGYYFHKDLGLVMAVQEPFVSWFFERHPAYFSPNGGFFYVETGEGGRVIAGVSVDRGTNHLFYKAFSTFVRDYGNVLPLGNILSVFNLFNLLENPYSRLFVYMKALDLALAANGKDQRKLFLTISNILKESKSSSSGKDAFEFLIKYLALFSGQDAHAICEAKEEAVRSIIEFVKSSGTFQDGNLGRMDLSGKGLRGKVEKPAYLEDWITTVTPLAAGDSRFDVSFDWDDKIGVPAPLISYREEELVNLRGNGAAELKEWDRVYDYGYYNDLGDPDMGAKYVRPVLGGSLKYPFPLRL